MRLAPLHLEIIVWYNSHVVDLENLEAPAVRNYLEQLLNAEIIRHNTKPGWNISYELTDKGRAYLEALLTVPFPVQKWEVQWPLKTT